MYFGQKFEEHIQTIKKRCLEIKKQRFLMKMRYMRKRDVFSALLPLFKGRAGPIWAHTGPYEPIWAHMDPKNLKEYVQIHLYRWL